MGAFYARGTPELVFIKSSMDSARYLSLLVDTLLSFTDAIYEEASCFQLDNAA